MRVELKLRSDRGGDRGLRPEPARAAARRAARRARRCSASTPGQRTGCKCAVVDATGKLLEHTTIYLVQGDAALASARARRCARSVRSTRLRAVAVGNGTHGRETEAFAREVLPARA